MAIIYDEASRSLRGTAAQIEQLRTALQGADSADAAAAIYAAHGIEADASDETLEGMRDALYGSVLTHRVTISGPGGRQTHVLDAGSMGGVARWSVAGEDMAELAGALFSMEAGLVSRLVRFRPGTVPSERATDVRVGADLITALADPSRATRLAAWERVRGLLGKRIDRQEADASWQLVQSHASWISTDGEPVEDLSVHLRAGDAYFVLVQDGEVLDLVPVPSITAWEAMMHVLPGHREVKRSAA